MLVIVRSCQYCDSRSTAHLAPSAGIPFSSGIAMGTGRFRKALAALYI
jgi:hypothetical protein